MHGHMASTALRLPARLSSRQALLCRLPAGCADAPETAPCRFFTADLLLQGTQLTRAACAPTTQMRVWGSRRPGKQRHAHADRGHTLGVARAPSAYRRSVKLSLPAQRARPRCRRRAGAPAAQSREQRQCRPTLWRCRRAARARAPAPRARAPAARARPGWPGCPAGRRRRQIGSAQARRPARATGASPSRGCRACRS